MSLNEKEKAALKASLRSMSFRSKLEYIFTYYKFHILFAVIIIVSVSSFVSNYLNRKSVPLYIGYANVSVGKDLEKLLTIQYLDLINIDANKNEIYQYKDMYISSEASEENHEYAYTSKLKLIASINAKQLDIIFMNKESYDIISANGYLTDLSDVFSGYSSALYEKISDKLTANNVIISDNTIEYKLGEVDKLTIETDSVTNGLYINRLDVFADAGFDGDVYIGIIANSPRMDTAVSYIEYLASVSS